MFLWKITVGSNALEWFATRAYRTLTQLKNVNAFTNPENNLKS
jgi:hypothetical protein